MSVLQQRRKHQFAELGAEDHHRGSRSQRNVAPLLREAHEGDGGDMLEEEQGERDDRDAGDAHERRAHGSCSAPHAPLGALTALHSCQAENLV